MTTTTIRQRPVRVHVGGDSCVCTADGMCLFPYAALDPGRRAAARRRAGVHEAYIGPRR